MADKISAYLKCKVELNTGNQEFNTAAEELLKKIQQSNLPEVGYFVTVFTPVWGLTLDKLTKPNVKGANFIRNVRGQNTLTVG